MIRRTLPLAAALALAVATGQAQGQQAPAAAAPLGAVVASAEWLHANSGALHRDALPSYGFGLGLDRPNGLRLEAGYLRVARPATTAEGFVAGAGWNFARGPVTVRPGVSALIGVGERNGDRDGYDWQGLDETAHAGEAGHQARLSTDRGMTLGGGLGIAADLHLTSGLSLTASLRQWVFSGRELSDNRDRTLAGLGLSLRPAILVQALKGRPATTGISANDKETDQ